MSGSTEWVRLCAEYSAKFLQKFAERLHSRGFSFRNLKLFRQIYAEYPQLSEPIKSYLKVQGITSKLDSSIGQLAISQLKVADNHNLALNPVSIFENFSYTHLTELIHIKDSLKRTFYEMECIKSVWTHKELQR